MRLIMTCELWLIWAIRSRNQLGLFLTDFVPSVPAVKHINQFERPHHGHDEVAILWVEYKKPPNDIEDVQTQPSNPLLDKTPHHQQLPHNADDNGNAVPSGVVNVEHVQQLHINQRADDECNQHRQPATWKQFAYHDVFTVDNVKRGGVSSSATNL